MKLKASVKLLLWIGLMSGIACSFKENKKPVDAPPFGVPGKAPEDSSSPVPGSNLPKTVKTEPRVEFSVFWGDGMPPISRILEKSKSSQTYELPFAVGIPESVKKVIEIGLTFENTALIQPGIKVEASAVAMQAPDIRRNLSIENMSSELVSEGRLQLRMSLGGLNAFLTERTSQGVVLSLKIVSENRSAVEVSGIHLISPPTLDQIEVNQVSVQDPKFSFKVNESLRSLQTQPNAPKFELLQVVALRNRHSSLPLSMTFPAKISGSLSTTWFYYEPVLKKEAIGKKGCDPQTQISLSLCEFQNEPKRSDEILSEEFYLFPLVSNLNQVFPTFLIQGELSVELPPTSVSDPVKLLGVFGVNEKVSKLIFDPPKKVEPNKVPMETDCLAICPRSYMRSAEQILESCKGIIGAEQRCADIAGICKECFEKNSKYACTQCALWSAPYAEIEVDGRCIISNVPLTCVKDPEKPNLSPPLGDWSYFTPIEDVDSGFRSFPYILNLQSQSTKARVRYVLPASSSDPITRVIPLLKERQVQYEPK